MEEIDLASLEKMRRVHADGDPKCTWAVYENQALDSVTHGHRIFILVGPGRTNTVPAPQAHDGQHGAGWKYRFIGFVKLDDGTVEKLQLEDAKARMEAA